MLLRCKEILYTALGRGSPTISLILLLLIHSNSWTLLFFFYHQSFENETDVLAYDANLINGDGRKQSSSEAQVLMKISIPEQTLSVRIVSLGGTKASSN